MSILRDITTQSKKYWDADEILIFIGARQSGKTTILKQIQTELTKENQPCFFLDLEDPDYLKLLNEHPKNLFKIFPIDTKLVEKKTVVFVDEIQYLKDPSNFLKYIFDEYKETIKLIVSGSSAFYIDSTFKDSLAGRKHIIFVPTLSFKEFLRFKNENSLSEKNLSEVSLDEKNRVEILYREFITYGGYPRVVLAETSEKEELLREIAYSFIKKDIYESGIKQEESFYGLLRLLAEQTGNLVNSSELANTLNVSKTAVDNYLFVMQKSFLIHLAKPFFRNVRKEITKMPKVFFLDLGLRNFFAKNFNVFDGRHDKGALLENSVFRQLLNNHHKDDINFWRTSSQKEIDFVVNEKEVIEVKTDAKTFKDKNLLTFLDSYPNMKFSLVTLNADSNPTEKYQIKNAWEM
jgi:hypothetical protein